MSKEKSYLADQTVLKDHGIKTCQLENINGLKNFKSSR